MPGLLEFAAAGLAEGIGKGTAEQWKLDRDERLRQLEAQRQDQRDAINRNFQSAEAQKGREFQAGENQATRDATRTNMYLQQNGQMGMEKMRIDASSEEAEKRRRFDETQGDKRDLRDAGKRQQEADQKDRTEGTTYTDDEGLMWRQRGDNLTPIIGPDGKQARNMKPASRTGVSTGGLSNTEKRLRYTAGIKAGAPQFTGGEQDWGKTVDEWNAQGLDPNDPDLRARVVSGLKENAQKRKLSGADATAFVDEQLRAMGIDDTSTTAVGKTQQGAGTPPQAQGAAGGKGDRGGPPQPRLESNGQGGQGKQPPAAFPNAQWSERYQQWVVQGDDGKYYPLVQR